MAIPFVVAAFEVMGATAAMTAAGGAMTLTAGLGYAAAGLTVAGAITGNKTLSTLGAIAGLGMGISGIADGMAASASAADSAAADAFGGSGVTGGPTGSATSGWEAQAAAPEAAYAGDVSGSAANATPAAESFGVSDPGAIQSSPLGAPASAEVAANPVVADAAANANPGSPLNADGSLKSTFNTKVSLNDVPNPAEPGVNGAGQTGPQPAAAAPAEAPVAVQQAAAAPQPSAAPQSASAEMMAGSNASGTGAGGTPSAEIGTKFNQAAANPKSWLDQLGSKVETAAKWAKANPALTLAGAGVVGGAMKYVGGQQMAEDNMTRSKAYQDWVRQRYSDSVRNLTIPKYQTPTNAGLIGAARG